MGNLRIIKTQNNNTVADYIKHVATNREAIKEMEGAFYVEDGQSWVIGFRRQLMVGFICYTDKEILYCYTMPEHRKTGVFSELYLQVPAGNYKTLTNNNSKDFFLKRGFKITKEYTFWTKMQNYD